MNRIKQVATAALAALSLWTAPAKATQDSCILPTVGTVSGLTLVQDINSCTNAMLSIQSGASAPGTPVTGMLWRDTSVTPQAIRQYDGANWNVVWNLDATNHLVVPPIGGGTIDNVASATITDLWAKPQAALTVSGTTTITQFANASAITGTIKLVKFTGIAQITYDATKMILPTAGNITTAVGDYAYILALTNTNVAVLYFRADGTALNASSNFIGAVFFNSAGTFTLGSNTNDWAPANFATTNVLKLTCSSAINVTGLAAPATDGKVVVIDNVGATNTCTFTAQDVLSTLGNRFAFDRAIAVRPGRSITLKYDISAARWRLIQEITTQPIAGGFKNLRVFNAPAVNYFGDTAPVAPNNSVKIVADELTVEDVNGAGVRLSSVNCSPDVTVSGAGGLDTGAVGASTFYSAWVIYNPATNAQNCIFSTRTNAFGGSSITLPSGYTFAARVGWIVTDGANHFLRLAQYGRNAQYVVTAASNTTSMPNLWTTAQGNTITPTWVATLVTTYIPVTASRGRFSLTSSQGVAMMAPNNAYAGATSTGNPPPCLASSNASIGFLNIVCDLLLETSNVYYASQTTNGAGAWVIGWEDNL